MSETEIPTRVDVVEESPLLTPGQKRFGKVAIIGGLLAMLVLMIGVWMLLPREPEMVTVYDRPDSVTYTVQQGDILNDVAARYGTTIVAILAANPAHTDLAITRCKARLGEKKMAKMQYPRESCNSELKLPNGEPSLAYSTIWPGDAFQIGCDTSVTLGLDACQPSIPRQMTREQAEAEGRIASNQ